MNVSTHAANLSKLAQRLGIASAALLLCASLSGCVAVGYTSGGGWFVWPGAGVLLVLALLFFFLRGRR